MRFMTLQLYAVTAFVASFLCQHQVEAQSLLLPFGDGTSDVFSPPNDDASSIEFIFPFPMIFYGEPISQAYQNTNGLITFDTFNSDFTPEALPSPDQPPMIAAYWTDIDTSDGGSSINQISARTISSDGGSNDVTDLETISDFLQSQGAPDSFYPKAGFVATWKDVEPFPGHYYDSSVTVTFQAIIAFDEEQTWLALFYDDLEFFSATTTNKTVVGVNDRLGTEGQMIKQIQSDSDMTDFESQGPYAFRIDNFALNDVCGLPGAIPRLSPPTGPLNGGTVLKISNLKDCSPGPSFEVYCRFDGGADLTSIVPELVPGFLSSDSTTVECVTPYSGKDGAAVVSYAFHDTSSGAFDINTATWVEISPTFQYSQAMNQGVLMINDKTDPSLAFATLPPHTDDNIAKWSGDALLLSAADSLGMTGSAASSDIQGELEIIDVANGEILYSVPIPDLSAGEVAFPFKADIMSFTSDWGIEDIGLSLVILRVSAFTTNSGGTKRIGATRTSSLVGVTPLHDQAATTTCPMKSCPSPMTDITPCPASYDQARLDFNFFPDDICKWPKGTNTCNVDSGIILDHHMTCNSNEGNADLYSTFCPPTEPLDSGFEDGCGCEEFHPGAAGCVVGGQAQCCYAESGALITTAGSGAGSADCYDSRSSPVEHHLYDTLPYLYCCKLNDNLCSGYYSERQPVLSDTYEPPTPPGWIQGDPHITTFDGLNYDFNGAGEYVGVCAMLGTDANFSLNDLLVVCDPSQTRLLAGREALSVHFRFAPLSPSDLGTVTVGIGIEDPSHNNGESGLTILTHPFRRIDVYDGQTHIEFPTPSLVSEETTSVIRPGGTYISKSVDISQTQVEVTITTPSGLSVSVIEIGGILMPSISLPTALSGTGRSVGLLGLYDGDTTNDLTDSSGFIVNAQNTEMSQSEINSNIFHNFGKSWMIGSADASIFKALTGPDSFIENHDPFFVPAFEPPIMTPELQLQADAVCAGLSDSLRDACYFDIAITKNAELFESVTSVAMQHEVDQATLANIPPKIIGNASQFASVDPSETVTFDTVDVMDVEGDDIIVSIDRNDNDLFTVSTTGNSTFKTIQMSFNGTSDEGVFSVWVSVSDGITPVLLQGTVEVLPSEVDCNKFSAKEECKTENAVCNWQKNGVDMPFCAFRPCKNVGPNKDGRDEQSCNDHPSCTWKPDKDKCVTATVDCNTFSTKEECKAEKAVCNWRKNGVDMPFCAFRPCNNVGPNKDGRDEQSCNDHPDCVWKSFLDKCVDLN